MLGSYLHNVSKVSIVSKQQYHIVCEETKYGNFTTQLSLKDFIQKNNKDTNCFFINKVYVLNPTDVFQCSSYLYIEVYDHNGELYVANDTFIFNPHPNNLESYQRMEFSGRDYNRNFQKDKECWFYNEYDKYLQQCVIIERPITHSEYKKLSHKMKTSIEWYDDSYMIKPFDVNGNMCSHSHILSCFMFSNNYINKLLNN